MFRIVLFVLLRVPVHPGLNHVTALVGCPYLEPVDTGAGPATTEPKPSILEVDEPLVLHAGRDVSHPDPFEVLPGKDAGIAQLRLVGGFRQAMRGPARGVLGCARRHRHHPSPMVVTIPAPRHAEPAAPSLRAMPMRRLRIRPRRDRIGGHAEPAGSPAEVRRVSLAGPGSGPRHPLRQGPLRCPLQGPGRRRGLSQGVSHA